MEGLPKKRLKRTFDMIGSLRRGCSVKTTLPFVPENATLVQDGRRLRVNFRSGVSNDIIQAHGDYLPEFIISFAGANLKVEQGRSFFGGDITIGRDYEQDLSISVGCMMDTRIDDREMFYRFVYPIRQDWLMTVENGAYEYETGHSRPYIYVELDGCVVEIFVHARDNQKFMVIDSQDRRTFKDMQKVSLAVRSSLGLFTGNVYSECQYVVASESADYDCEETYFGFTMLKESVACPYMIFNTNRVDLKENLSRYNYQKYALDAIQDDESDVIWYYDEEPAQMSAVSYLANLLYKDNNLLTAANMMLEVPAMTVSYQVLAYCVALEAITTSLLPDDHSPLMDKSEFKKNVVPKLQEALNLIEDMPDEAKRIMGLRINNLNNPANQDKLTVLFDKFGYQLTKFDKEALKLRNTNLHGNIIDKANRQDDFDEFELELLARALRLHKLCCIILLKASGFSGKILNNEVVHGMEAACARKEPAVIVI